MLKKAYLLIVIIFSLTNVASGSHLLGTDLSYVHDTANTYIFTIKVLKDCNSSIIDSIGGFVTSGSNSTNFYIGKTSTHKVTTVCDTVSSVCTQNNSNYFGYNEITYTYTVDFNKAPYSTWRKNGACDFVISWAQASRIGEITTIDLSSVSYTYYLYGETSINLCNIAKTRKLTNNSPILTPNYSSVLGCNVPIRINQGARDHVDFDSLTYGMILPRHSPSVQIKYKSPWSGTYPMTTYCSPSTRVDCKPIPNANPPRGFFFNPENGDIIFTPRRCDEVSPIVIETKEWRKDSAGKYLLIGKTMREMTFYVNHSSYNLSPEIKSGKFDYTVCEGDSIDFKIYGVDDSFLTMPVDTVSLSWDSAIANATFTITDTTAREKEATFKWRTKIGDAKGGLYSFVVLAKDGNCPYESISYRRFNIKVLPRVNGNIKFEQNCNKLEYGIKLDNNLSNPTSHIWEIITSNNDTIRTANILDTIELYSIGVNYFRVKLNNDFNCPASAYDSFEIKSDTNLRPRITVPDTHFSICAGEKIEFSIFTKDSSVQSILRLDTVSLYTTKLPPRSTFHLVDSNSREKEGKFVWKTNSFDVRDSVYAFTMIAIDDFCPFPDTTYQTITIKVNGKPIAFSSMTETCEHIIYDAGLANNTKLPAQVLWKIKKGNILFDSSTLLRDSLESNLDATYHATLFVNDGNQCKDTFTRSINAIMSPSTDAKINLVGTCKKVQYSANLKKDFNTPARYKWYVQENMNFLDSSDLSLDSFNYQNDSNYLITLLIKNKFKCVDTLTKSIKISNGTNFPPSIVSSKDSYAVCANDTLEFSVQVQEKINTLDSIKVNWNQIKGTSIQRTRNSASDKTLKFKWITKETDAHDSVYKLNIIAQDNACPNQDTSYKTIRIKVNALPKAKREFHEFCGEKGMVHESVLDSNTKGKILYNWSIMDSINNVLQTSSHAVDTFRASYLGKYFSQLQIEDTNGCKSSFRDTINLRYYPSNLDLGNDTTITDEDSLYLRVKTSFKEYLWSTGSKDSMIKVFGKIVGAGSYRYWVVTKDTLGCNYGDTINIIVTSTISIIETNHSDLIYYPSPVSETLSIELLEGMKNGTISIFNTLGKLVKHIPFVSDNGNIIKVPVSYLPAGMYVLRVKENEQVYTFKFQKE